MIYVEVVASRILEFFESKHDKEKCFHKAVFFISSVNVSSQGTSNSRGLAGWELSFLSDCVELDNTIANCGCLSVEDIAVRPKKVG